MLSVVIAGGDQPPEPIIDDLVAADRIVVADSGVATARRLGLVPDVVVGDLDSARPDDLAWARGHGATVVEHDADKDLTDLELALQHVTSGAPDRIVVLGASGGRIDHELGNWAAIAAVAAPVVEVRDARGTAYVVSQELPLSEPVGTVVSVQPWGGPAVVTTEGLRWALQRERLSPFEARGVSNEIVTSPARIEVASGVVLVMLPSSA